MFLNISVSIPLGVIPQQDIDMREQAAVVGRARLEACPKEEYNTAVLKLLTPA